MLLPPGTQLGAYRIADVLGVGGMGEVYRAHDTRLGRDVALKILPAAFRSDPDRLARFEREARALAALNHPNIATIHGLDELSGVHALVLELVAGETLEQRIGPLSRSGPPWPRAGLPLADTIAIARQIADALEAAHERGIVHRDLKPANVKITGEGLVKVLDFGLAKALDPADPGSSPGAALSHSPTFAIGETQTGVILGTASYMSPEQARGRPVDRRTDIWAFGCVLYEMLTGRVAFSGATVSDVIVGILDRTPDWTAVPPDTPAAVLRLLRRCLEKDARRRLRDIGDARIELEETSSAAADPVAASVLPHVRHIEFQRLTYVEGLKEAPAVSPDGRMVAFAAVVRGKRQIRVRLLAGGSVLQLTHDEVDHLHPRWAPDSSTLLYFTPAATEAEAGALWEIGALGGWPRRIATAAGPGDISHDGRRIALLHPSEDHLVLAIAARDGSSVQPIARLSPGTCTCVRWAPDDRSIAYQRLGHAGFDGHIEVARVDTGECHEVVSGAWLEGLAWLPDGSGLVYSSSRDSTLLYPPIFNLRTVRRDGSDDRQLTFGDHSYVDPDVHATGKLIAARTISRSDIWRFPIGGSPRENTDAATRVTRQTGHVQAPSVSPDEREIVFVSDIGGHANLWMARTDGSGERPITFQTDPDVAFGVPVWSPRGDLIVFVTSERGRVSLRLVRADGSPQRQLLDAWAPCWSADGRWLYYQQHAEPAGLVRIQADGGAPEFIRAVEGVTVSAIAPDGTTLFMTQHVRSNVHGLWGTGFLEYVRASPPDGPCTTLARVAGHRLPARLVTFNLSPDARYLAVTLIDGATTNIWRLPTAGGPMTPVTDFGDRSIVITRSVPWSRDSQHVYAAVAETETDVVLLDGLLPPA